MKTIVYELIAASSVFAASAYAVTIDADETWPDSGYTLTENVTVTNGATLTTEGNITTGNYGMTVEAGSTIAFNNPKSAEFKMASPSAETVNTVDFYGTVVKTGAGGLNFILADNIANNTVINFHEGSLSKSENGQMNFEVRRGTGTVNVMKGATLGGVNDFHVGGRGDAAPVGTLNVQGSATFGAWIRLGNTGLNSGLSGKAALNVTDGGYLKARDLATNVGTGYDASIVLKDVGSQLVVSNAVTLNVVNDSRSTSSLRIQSGANFKVENANGLTSNSGNSVVFGLDSNIQAAASTAMLSISKLTVNTADSAKTFSIDASQLGAVAGLSAGDTIDIILIDSLSSIAFNGAEYDFSALDDAALQGLLSDFMEFEFAGNENWEAADISDIRKVDDSIVLGMTYVPEPGVCAVLFGAAAVVLAFWRRRA